MQARMGEGTLKEGPAVRAMIWGESHTDHLFPFQRFKTLKFRDVKWLLQGHRERLKCLKAMNRQCIELHTYINV